MKAGPLPRTEVLVMARERMQRGDVLTNGMVKAVLEELDYAARFRVWEARETRRREGV